MTFVKRVLDKGGKIAPIVIPASYSDGSGLMNPSVFVDKDGDILVNLRHVNYTLYHSEYDQHFISRWGPLTYIHPEQYMKLATTNHLCKLTPDLEVEAVCTVDTSTLDVEPLWEFVGLEDARVTYWDGKYYLIGVRRDTTTNGQGRMELSEIELNKSEWTAKEISRFRVPTPFDIDTYCEKNWMPVLDEDYKLVKWTSPTEVVQVNPADKTCVQIAHNQGISAPADQRGGSQVFNWRGYRVAIVHEVNLFNNYLGQKDGIYRHRLAVWDGAWNLIGLSPEPFSFMDGRIEFCAGASVYGNDLLITFGFQDNAAFILQAPGVLINELVLEALSYAG